MAERTIAVQEETVRVGGVDVTKKTMVAATDEGVVTMQVHTVQQSPVIQSQPMPAPPPVVMYTDGAQANNCCARGWCECDSSYKWYSLYGKGWGIVLLLLLMYLIIGTILIAIWVLCACLAGLSGDDDN